jgi:hypothetical protein
MNKSNFPVNTARSIDWLESTSRSLRAAFPQAGDCSDPLTERLSVLLLERLAPELRLQLVALLPRDKVNAEHLLLTCLHGNPADSSIGFISFVERARHSLGLSEVLDSPPYNDSEAEFEKLCNQMAEVFLWAVSQEFPPELKTRMIECLPLDLRSRMNLYSGHTDEGKVA